jgi:sigma-B regulation protein RsbU (phosphoserine phosphatase)
VLHFKLELALYDSIKAVEYLHLAAQNIFDNKDKITLHKALRVKYINKNGNYALDDNSDINLLGFGKTSLSHKKLLQEMEAALHLAPFFKLVYTKNKNFAWVYYYSKNHFTVLCPYVSSKDFNLTPALEKKPFFEYATPKVNPQKKLFFTPLYMDAIGKGLMVTVGKPLYCHDEFIGTLNVDITLNNLDNVLSRLDDFDNKTAVYNEKKQIVASHNIIKQFNRSKIYKINDFIVPSVLNMPDTLDSLKYVDAQYVFVKTLSDCQFRFIYIANAYTIWLKSFYIFPLYLYLCY